jgi:hypothetical protein
MMELVVYGSTVNVFVIPIVSGTFPLEMVKLFPSNLYKVQEANIQMMSTNIAIDLLKLELRSKKVLLLNDERLLRTLLSMIGINPIILSLTVKGPVARIFEYFCKVIIDEPTNLDGTVIYNAVRNVVLEKYQPPRVELLHLTEILYYVLCKVKDPIKSPIIQKYLREGIVNILPTKVVTIPYIILDLLISNIPNILVSHSFLYTFVSSTTILNPINFEQFTPQFYAYIQQL